MPACERAMLMSSPGKNGQGNGYKGKEPKGTENGTQGKDQQRALPSQAEPQNTSGPSSQGEASTQGEAQGAVETSIPTVLAPILGRGQGQLTRSEVRILQTAIVNGWPVTPERRAAWLDQLDRLAREGKTEIIRLKAIDLGIRADAVNVRRESNLIQERGTELSAASGLMRTALASPEGRKALAGLTSAVLPEAPRAGPAG